MGGLIRHRYLTERHVRWARRTDVTEQATREFLLARMPAVVVDMHAHAAHMGGVGTLSPYAWRQVRSSFPVWSLRDSRRVAAQLYGERKVLRLRMAHPYRGIRHESVNTYLRRHTSPNDFAVLCGKPDDEWYTQAEIESGAYFGLKMYPHYREPPYGTIKEFFPSWAMRAATRADVPVIVHVRRPPSTGWQEVVELADEHTEARIVLAHLGREMVLSADAELGFAKIAECANVAMDVSMATNPEIMALALSTFGDNRIMFGSDEPFNLLRYVDVLDSGGQRELAPARPYNWVSQTDFARLSPLAGDAPLVHWQVLHNLVTVSDTSLGGDSDYGLCRIFGQNALTWFKLPRNSNALHKE